RSQPTSARALIRPTVSRSERPCSRGTLGDRLTIAGGERERLEARELPQFASATPGLGCGQRPLCEREVLDRGAHRLEGEQTPPPVTRAPLAGAPTARAHQPDLLPRERATAERVDPIPGLPPHLRGVVDQHRPRTTQRVAIEFS